MEKTIIKNEEKQFICNADIKPSFKRNKILIILSIISLMYIALVSIPVPFIKTEMADGDRQYYAILNFGVYILGIWECVDYWEYLWTWVLFLIWCGTLPLVIYFIICAVEISAAKQCSLYFTDKEIYGTIKYSPFSFTMDKINNVYAVNDLRGGKTIVISVESRVIKFHWVQNADEFVKKAWEVIQEFKEIEQKNVT